jgi:hypothetical protein
MTFDPVNAEAERQLTAMNRTSKKNATVAVKRR